MEQFRAKEFIELHLRGGDSDSHEVNVRDLAPALIALSDFIESANDVVNGENIRLNLRFRASGKGSIILDLGLDLSLLQRVVDIFSGDAVSAMLNLKEVVLGLSATGTGLFWLIKKLKNRRIKEVEKKGDRIILVLEDGQFLEISQELFKLLQDSRTRVSLSKFINLFDSDVANELEFSSTDVLEPFKVTVTKDEVAYFVPPPIGEILINEQSNKMAVSIVSLTFKEDNMWRVSTGDKGYMVKMSDEVFISDVQKNKASFRKDDILIVEMLTKQWRGDKGLRTDYEITKVYEHKPPVTQIPLDF